MQDDADDRILEPLEAYRLWVKDYPPLAHNLLMTIEQAAVLSLVPEELGGLNVLDAACGTGRYARVAQERGAARTVGTDLSPEMLARGAEEGVGRLVESLEQARPGDHLLLEAPLERIPLPDGWAGLTLCGLAVGHVADLRAVLAELRRVTRHGGGIVLSDFHPARDAAGLCRTFKVDDRRYRLRHHRHFYSDWHRASRDAGLRITDVVEPFVARERLLADLGAEVDERLLELALALPVALVLRLEAAR